MEGEKGQWTGLNVHKGITCLPLTGKTGRQTEM